MIGVYRSVCNVCVGEQMVVLIEGVEAEGVGRIVVLHVIEMFW